MPSTGNLIGSLCLVALAWGIAVGAEGQPVEGGIALPNPAAPATPPGPARIAPRIRKITFEGRRWIPQEVLLEITGLNPGTLLLPGAEVEAARRLQKHPRLTLTGSPRVTRIADDRVDLSFPMMEMAVIGEIHFSGNSVFWSWDLLTATSLKVGMPLEDVGLEAARAALLDKYHRDGFLLAGIQVTTQPANAGRRDVSFVVNEGRRVYVRAVTLEGAEQVAASEPLGYLSLQPRRLFGMISPGFYIPEDMPADLDRLRGYYISHGFFSAKVGLGGLEFDREFSLVSIELRVKEGPRYIVSAVRVEGSKAFSAKTLEGVAAIPTGGYYSGPAVREGVQRIHRWYEGHSDRLPRIRIEDEYEDTGNRVALVVQVQDEHFLETGEVRIEGNTVTRDRVIRKEIGLLPGLPFAETELKRTRERIERTRFFKKVEVEALESVPSRDDPETRVVDVRVKVEERETEDEARRFVEVGGGASSGAGEVAYVNVQRNNFDLFRLPRAWSDWDAFKGGGQHLNFELIPGTRQSFYNFRFEEPYFFRSDLSLSLKAGLSLLDRNDYDESRYRVQTEVRKSFDRDRHLTAALAYVGDSTRIHGLDANAPPDVVEAEGWTFVSYPRLELRYDPRKLNFYSGATGFRARARMDLASDILGSDSEFARVSAVTDYYLPLHLFDENPDFQHILHVDMKLSWMEGLNGEDVPLFERFYLGGPWSFRGFKYRRLGPHQGGTPVGGEGAIHGTVDYSFPLVWKEIRGFAVFHWGDLESRFSDISTNRFRTAAGGGLLLRLKMLGQTIPANFYWVYALQSQQQDREQLFQFTIGMSF